MAYSEKEKKNIIDSICGKIINGSSLRRAMSELGIAYDTFFRWIDEDDSKSKQYARATELRAEAMAEEILSISDKTSDDVIIDDEGKEVTNFGIIQRDRLRVDTRKFLMAKMKPKKYGDKVGIDHTTGGEKINHISLGTGVKPPDDE